ncbi:MAG: DUF3833 family protein [Alphaproteobacteria bacterium]
MIQNKLLGVNGPVSCSVKGDIYGQAMNFLTPLNRKIQTNFRLETFFEGNSRAEGLFEDRFGNIRKRFSAAIQGTYNENTLTLDESFEYDDGSEERRKWKIVILEDGTYEGRSSDVVGKAIGEIANNTLHWSYSMMLPVGKRKVRVRFEDKMWLMSSGDLLNRARVYKYGILIGSVTIVFKKDGSSIGHMASDQPVDITKTQIVR